MSNVSFSGNYGGPSFPEVKKIRSGKSVITIPVFVSSRTESGWTDVRKNVTLWGDLADNFARSAKMGDRVVVVGREKVNEWNDANTGEPRSRQIVEATDIGLSVFWNGVFSERQAKDFDEGQNELVDTANEIVNTVRSEFFDTTVTGFDGEDAEEVDIPI